MRRPRPRLASASPNAANVRNARRATARRRTARRSAIGAGANPRRMARPVVSGRARPGDAYVRLLAYEGSVRAEMNVARVRLAPSAPEPEAADLMVFLSAANWSAQPVSIAVTVADLVHARAASVLREG